MRKITTVLTVFLALLLIREASAAEYWVSLNEHNTAFTQEKFFVEHTRLATQAGAIQGSPPKQGPLNKRFQDYVAQKVISGDIIGFPRGTVLEVLKTYEFRQDNNDGKTFISAILARIRIKGYSDVYLIATSQKEKWKYFEKLAVPVPEKPVKCVVKNVNTHALSYAAYQTMLHYHVKEQDKDKTQWFMNETIKAGLVFPLTVGTKITILKTTDNGKLGLIAGYKMPFWVPMINLEKVKD